MKKCSLEKALKKGRYILFKDKRDDNPIGAGYDFLVFCEYIKEDFSSLFFYGLNLKFKMKSSYYFYGKNSFSEYWDFYLLNKKEIDKYKSQIFLEEL